VIEIEDAGSGIKREMVPHLGQSLLSAPQRPRHDTDGLGIGLALATRLTALTGGQLAFSSEPGAGTTAKLALPLAKSLETGLQSGAVCG